MTLTWELDLFQPSDAAESPLTTGGKAQKFKLRELALQNMATRR